MSPKRSTASRSSRPCDLVAFHDSKKFAAGIKIKVLEVEQMSWLSRDATAVAAGVF